MRMNRVLVWEMILVLMGGSAMLCAAAEEKKAANVDGKWTWTYKTKDGKDAEAAIKLKQEGDKLTGAYIARDGTQTPIQDGKIKGDEISFDVNREVGGERMLFKYTGKIEGDTITGKIVFGHPKPTPHEWEAKRGKE
jgi:D-glucosaminate-6-phosphate ammonia-lyase